MQYTLTTISVILAVIKDEEEQIVAKAYRRPDRAWEIINSEKRYVGHAEKKGDILRVYEREKDNIKPLPVRVCADCPYASNKTM
jgi:hypothetical protein